MLLPIVSRTRSVMSAEHPRKMVLILIPDFKPNLRNRQGGIQQKVHRLIHLQPSHILMRRNIAVLLKQSRHIPHINIALIRHLLHRIYLRKILVDIPFASKIALLCQHMPFAPPRLFARHLHQQYPQITPADFLCVLAFLNAFI